MEAGKGWQLMWRSVQVEGLAADVQGDFQAWGVLELDPLRFVGGETYRPCRP